MCRTSSHPPAEFRWLKDGVFISNFSSSLYSIRIENIRRNDSGVYRCIAKNEFGSILSSGAKLEVSCKYDRKHVKHNIVIFFSLIVSMTPKMNALIGILAFIFGVIETVLSRIPQHTCIQCTGTCILVEK